MSTYNRQTVMASWGNYTVKAGGAPVVLPGDGDDVFNVFTGEIVVFNPRTNLTLDSGDIATASHVSIAIGVGERNNLASDLLYVGGEQFDLVKSVTDVSVTPPVCGIPQVIDIFFDGSNCQEVYTLAFHLDDSRIRSEYAYNNQAEYVFTVPTNCAGCDDCDPAHNVDELACAFVDQINATVQKDPSKITYFQRNDMSKQYQPFEAARLYVGDDTSKRWNIEVDETGTAAITGIRLDAVDTTFDYTVNTKDTTKTLPSQLKRVVKEINKALADKGGSAVLKGSLEPKTGYFIEINTCVASVQLLDDGGSPIEPSYSLNPYSESQKSTLCKGCGVSPETVNMTGGIRIFVDPIEVPTEHDSTAYPPNMPAPNTYIRKLTPAFAGEGWNCHNHDWIESQEQLKPEGFGYYWKDRAHYGNHTGGAGRNHRYSNKRVGRIGLPDAYSRASNEGKLIDYGESYCVYNMRQAHTIRGQFNNNKSFGNTNLTYVLVPEGDTTTKTSWETYLTEFISAGLFTGDTACGVKITGVVVTPASSSIAVAGTQQLTATVSPGTAVQTGTWSSDDESVATVSGTGLVTGVAAGTAKITFVAADGVTKDIVDITVT